jgi:integrase
VSTLSIARARKRKPPKPRRARGTGAFFWSESLKLWVGRVKVGRRPDGRPHYVERRAPTQKELNDKLAAVRPPGPRTTVAEWAERWFGSLLVRPSTAGDYRHTLDRFVLPELGHLPVADLTPAHVEFAARRWADRLGPNTLRKNLRTLGACLEAARRARLLADNPVRDARKPRSRRRTVNVFSPAELADVVAAAALRPADRIFGLLASTGCRIGEALALDAEDFAGGAVSIRRTYSRKHGLRACKTENGVRTIRVPGAALPAVGPRAKSGPLFPSPAGGRRQHKTVYASWRLFLGRLGLAYRNVHQLRHSVATALVSAGVPVGDVARYLGDSVGVVVKTYTHATGADPADALDRVFGGR